MTTTAVIIVCLLLFVVLLITLTAALYLIGSAAWSFFVKTFDSMHGR